MGSILKTLYIYTVAVFVFVSFAGLGVEGLYCDVCHRVGVFGSDKCQTMACNNAADVKLSMQALDALDNQVAHEMGYQPWEEETTTRPDLLEQLSHTSLNPVCMKMLGTISPEQAQLPYLVAGCMSANYFPIEDTPCRLSLVPGNDFDVPLLGSTNVQPTINQLCVCGENNHSNQEPCHVSALDMTGDTLASIRANNLGTPTGNNATVNTTAPQMVSSGERVQLAVIMLPVLVGLSVQAYWN